MTIYRATFHMRGPTGGDNPWTADTIFGHLCWALKYTQNETRLLEFLGEYREAGSGQEVPLLVSNGFPEGLLPKPLHLEHRPLETGSDEENFVHLRAVKGWPWLTLPEFERVRQGSNVVETSARRDGIVTRVTLKNQIDRMTATTGEGGNLFGFEETFIPSVTIYCDVRDDYVDTVEALFRAVAATGYGKRKAVGYGSVRSLEWEPFDGFGDVDNANAFISLSNFAPARGDPTRGWWRTMVKYGRLGEEYAHSQVPFKRPVTMLTAGSVLLDPVPRRWYGRMVRNVAPAVSGDIVQYGYAMTLPARIPDEPEAPL